MKKLNKAISLFLALILLLSCSSVALAENDTPITKPNAVVLVLDVSGSMSGERIIKLKEATNKFAEKLIEGGTNNKIAIVTFANSCSTLPFTNDLIEIKHFMSTKNASGGTDMTSGINNADSLLSNEELTNYNKSIVIMSDGEPNNINSAKSAATALFDKYNIYSVGLNLSSSQKAFMQSIQNKGYFDADSVEKLITVFLEAVEEILAPFTIKLFYKNTSKKENEQTPGSYTYKFEVTAKIKNENSKQTDNVKVSINLGQSMVLSSASNQTENIGSLSAGEAKTLTWNVEMPMVVLGVTTYDVYSVTASSDNTSDITVSDKIIITDNGNKNNELDFSKDIWSFENYTVDKIPLTTEDYNAIMYGRSNTEREFIDKKINSYQNGQCYGMAATTILTKMNIIGISNLQNSANCLYDVEKTEKSTSLIGYYFITQWQSAIQEEQANFTKKSDHDKLLLIKSLAENVANGGSPFILSFCGTTKKLTFKGITEEDWGHAVVAYAYESGSFRKNGRSYSHRILIYDNNSTKWNEDSCLYFNLGDSSWYIPKYPDATSLTRALADLKIMDISDVEIDRENSYAYLEATKNVNFIINSPTKNYNINGLKTTDTMTFCNDGSGDLCIVLPDKDEKYTAINPNGKDLLDLSMRYDNYYMEANSSKCDNVEFNPNGSVYMNGNEADFKIKLTGNDGYTSLPWYTITVSGNKTSNPALIKNNNGYIFEGDNLDNITITGKNDNGVKELTFTTSENKVLISEISDELTVLVDKDNNGTYETVIASSDGDISPQLESLETKDFKLIPGFNPALRYYISFVSDSVSKVSLAPTMNSETTATISVNGSKYEEFKSEFTMELKTGINIIKITVTDTKGNSNEYVLTVVKGLWSMIQPGLVLIANISVAVIKVIVQYIIYFFKLLM